MGTALPRRTLGRVSAAAEPRTRRENTVSRRCGRPDGRRLLLDVALAVGLGTAAVVEAFLLDGTEQDTAPGISLTLVIALVTVAGAVVARRTAPVPTLFLAACVSAWLGSGYVLTVVLAYVVGYRIERLGRAAAGVLASAILPAAVGWYLVDRHKGPEYDLALIVGVSVTVLTVSALLGRYRRQRAALVAAGWDRAERLERERSLIIDQARLRERSRIAQDMHDSLGHELSLIALQAGALELDSELSARQREVAQRLRTTTGEAVTRLREIVGVLRADDESAPMLPAADGVAALVERAAAAGLDVRLEPDPAPPVLPPLTDRAAYRVVQEALTNASKHAPDAPVVVRLGHDDHHVTVTVTNEAPTSDRTAPAGPTATPTTTPATTPTATPTATPTGNPAGGRGLIGLAERVRVAGGVLSAGPHRDGYQLTARLPLTGSPAPSASPSPTSAAAPPLPAFTPAAGELAQLDGYPSVVSLLRRRFWITLVVPALVLAALSAGYLMVVGMRQAIIPTADFQTLRIGQSQASVEERLPVGTPDPPGGYTWIPAPPTGTTCRHYLPRTDGLVDFDTSRLFRLCYTDGRLVSRQVFRAKGTEQR